MRTTANVEVIGYLSGDAQLTYSTDGEALLRFSIANNIKHGNGEEETNWYNCRISGKRAEALQPHLVKSTALFVRGPLVAREWEGNDGRPRTSLDLRVKELEFLGSRGERPGSEPGRPADGEMVSTEIEEPEEEF